MPLVFVCFKIWFCWSFLTFLWIYDAFSLIIFSFPGHLNDASTYRYLPSIGFGRQRPLPRNARILADGGYPAQIPLVAPHRIARNRVQRTANRKLRQIRVKVEHTIGAVKIYKSVGEVFRQKRSFLPIVVTTCGLLTNRRKLLISRARGQ